MSRIGLSVDLKIFYYFAAETKNQTSTPVKPRESPIGLPNIWLSSTGQKVPFITEDVHDRVLQFLATGKDSAGIAMPLSMGLSWDRLIEMAGVSIVNSALAFLKQSQSRQNNR